MKSSRGVVARLVRMIGDQQPPVLILAGCAGLTALCSVSPPAQVLAIESRAIPRLTELSTGDTTSATRIAALHSLTSIIGKSRRVTDAAFEALHTEQFVGAIVSMLRPQPEVSLALQSAACELVFVLVFNDSNLATVFLKAGINECLAELCTYFTTNTERLCATPSTISRSFNRSKSLVNIRAAASAAAATTAAVVDPQREVVDQKLFGRLMHRTLRLIDLLSHESKVRKSLVKLNLLPKLDEIAAQTPSSQLRHVALAASKSLRGKGHKHKE